MSFTYIHIYLFFVYGTLHCVSFKMPLFFAPTSFDLPPKKIHFTVTEAPSNTRWHIPSAGGTPEGSESTGFQAVTKNLTSGGKFTNPKR